VKRSSICVITLLILVPACSPAPDATPNSEDAVSVFSPEQALDTSTPQPTSTSIVPTPTSQADELPQETPEEAATGEIFGRITNGTSGGEVPVGLVVTLFGVDGQMVVLEVEGETGAGGEFVFEDIEMATERLFVIAAEHQGVAYFTEAVSMPVDQKALELPLTVFDSTEDPAFVSVEQLHILFDFNSPGAASVLEVWVITNAGDRTYTPSAGGLEITLPEGASALRFQEGGMGDRFHLSESGFFDLAPVRPGVGSSQMLFIFDLPYERRLDFMQPMSLQIQAIDVLLPEGGPAIREGDLVDGGVRQVSTGNLKTYSTGPIAPGEVLEFRISGRMPGAEGGADFTPLMGLVIGGAVLGIALIGLGLWWYRLGGRPSAAEPDDEPDVLRAIAELDDEHAAGKISEAEYRKRREALKQRALEFMQEEND
jgi:uncharacterized membrane protein